jgi:hypothetical protein
VNRQGTFLWLSFYPLWQCWQEGNWATSERQACLNTTGQGWRITP